MQELRNLSNKELIESYSKILKLLKERGVIRSKIFIGDLAEYLVIEHYRDTPNLPKLQPAPSGTKNVDALSIKGERYSIKATTGKVTGVFYGLNPPSSQAKEIQRFEYVIIAIFDEDYKLNRILELNWDMFLKFKRWHSRMRAWNITITKDLIETSRAVFSMPVNPKL